MKIQLVIIALERFSVSVLDGGGAPGDNEKIIILFVENAADDEDDCFLKLLKPNFNQ